VRIAVRHRTVYRYDHPIRFSAQYLRLTPRVNASQQTVRWTVNGQGRFTPWTDGFGNACHTLVSTDLADEISVEAKGIVETNNVNGVLPDDGLLPVQVFLRSTPLTQVDAGVREFLLPFRGSVRDSALETAHALSHALRERVSYVEGSTDVHSTAAEVFASERGVCQDMAHLFIGCARELGIPARYVSGYFCTAEGAADAVASHAWAAIWVDNLGWVSFDLANGTCGTEQHIGLAVGLDYSDTAPVRGIRTGGAGERMDVLVTVQEAQ
jgi:transglutaminase-like putative cysteine protease